MRVSVLSGLIDPCYQQGIGLILHNESEDEYVISTKWEQRRVHLEYGKSSCNIVNTFCDFKQNYI